MSEHSAVPLCLPNNCKWDEQTGEYSKDEDQDRIKLNVINAALEQLKAIKGWRNGIKIIYFSLLFFFSKIHVFLIMVRCSGGGSLKDFFSSFSIGKDTNILSSGVTLPFTFFTFWQLWYIIASRENNLS